jgi:hypothetical protein
LWRRTHGEGAITSLSVNQLNRELRLEDRGEADGRKEYPGSDAVQLSEAEAAVVSRVQGALATQSKALLGDRAAGDFAALPQELDALASEPQTILTAFRGRKARAQTSTQIELDHAYTDFQRAYQGYRSFRRQHDLTQTEPRYDTVFWRKVFWLTLLFTIEVAANGWVIGQAAPGGLIQGWTTALMISILVVLTGTLIGIGPWRYLSYRGPEGRGRLHLLWAAPAVLVGLAALTFFALYVAHYRYALAHTSLEAPVPDHILSSVLGQPFAPFEQLDSVILFVIAMLIGVFSIVRGVLWDDPYPGYGHLHRRMMDERERTRGIAQRLAGQVDEARDAAAAALAEVGAKNQQAMGALRQALSRARDHAAEWDRSGDALLAVGDEAIAIYRSANRRTRRTPEPRYFADDPFSGLGLASSAEIVSSLENALAQAVTSNTHCRSQLAGAQAQLETEYKAFYSDELAPFLRGVSEGAATKVKEEINDGRPPDAPPPPTPNGEEPKSDVIVRPRRFGRN